MAQGKSMISPWQMKSVFLKLQVLIIKMMVSWVIPYLSLRQKVGSKDQSNLAIQDTILNGRSELFGLVDSLSRPCSNNAKAIDIHLSVL